MQALLSGCKTSPMFNSSKVFGLLALFLVSNLSISLFSQPSAARADTSDLNETKYKLEVIRIVKPGVFDMQTKEYVVRMRMWGVSYPKRGQPGFEQAILFCE